MAAGCSGAVTQTLLSAMLNARCERGSPHGFHPGAREPQPKVAADVRRQSHRRAIGMSMNGPLRPSMLAAIPIRSLCLPTNRQRGISVLNVGAASVPRPRATPSAGAVGALRPLLHSAALDSYGSWPCNDFACCCPPKKTETLKLGRRMAMTTHRILTLSSVLTLVLGLPPGLLVVRR